MTTIASQNTSLTIVYSIVYSDADQRKHQSSASLAFVRGIHRWPVNSPHKRPVTRKMFPLDDVIMYWRVLTVYKLFFALQWRHNELAGVSNHQPHDCLPNRLFTCKSKKTWNSASLLYWTFVRGIHRCSPARPVSQWCRKCLPAMTFQWLSCWKCLSNLLMYLCQFSPWLDVTVEIERFSIVLFHLNRFSAETLVMTHSVSMQQFPQHIEMIAGRVSLLVRNAVSNFWFHHKGF